MHRLLPAAVAVLGIGLAVTLVVGLMLWATSSTASDIVLGRVLPAVFFAFGAVSAAAVLSHRHASRPPPTDDTTGES